MPRLIEYTNRVMDTNQALICSRRPRRFGKSITANNGFLHHANQQKILFRELIRQEFLAATRKQKWNDV